MSLLGKLVKAKAEELLQQAAQKGNKLAEKGSIIATDLAQKGAEKLDQALRKAEDVKETVIINSLIQAEKAEQVARNISDAVSDFGKDLREAFHESSEPAAPQAAPAEVLVYNPQLKPAPTADSKNKTAVKKTTAAKPAVAVQPKKKTRSKSANGPK